MSSARANAAARQRRAGGNEPIMNPPQQQQMNKSNSQGQPQQPMQRLQLSISDAIALITLRLGKVESIIQNMPVDGQNDNTGFVDQGVFASIVARLENLEKNQQQQNQQLQQQLQKQPQQPQQQILEDNSVKEDIIFLNEEIFGIKDILLKLQAFTMDTNQKLVNIVLENVVTETTKTIENVESVTIDTTLKSEVENEINQITTISYKSEMDDISKSFQ